MAQPTDAKLTAKKKLCLQSIEESNNIYRVPLITTYSNDAALIKKCFLGKPMMGSTEKVLLMMGKTGSGKTTCITRFLNYIFDVSWEDGFQFEMIDEGPKSVESLTKWVTAYTIHQQDLPGFNLPYTVTIVDTPGFVDTDGFQRESVISSQIKTFFETRGDHGVDHIDAVCVVVQSSTNKLTAVEDFIFDSIRNIFGRDIANNIILLVTFSHGGQPLVLDVVRAKDLPFVGYFEFNNLVGKNNSNPGLSQYHWDTGTKSSQDFFERLGRLPAISVFMTKENLKERNRIEVFIQGIQQQITMGLNQLEVLRKEHVTLKEHAANVEVCKTFDYWVDEDVPSEQKLQNGERSLVCESCKYTCHYPCLLHTEEDIKMCFAMTAEYCTVCPKRCRWDAHKLHPYRLITTVKPRQRSLENLRSRYEAAQQKRYSQIQLLKAVEDDFYKVKTQVMQMMDGVRQAIARLKEVALHPNPLTASDYIELLIDAEESSAKPGFSNRIKHLENVKGKFEMLSNLSNDNFNPFANYDDLLDEVKRLCQQIEPTADSAL